MFALTTSDASSAQRKNLRWRARLLLLGFSSLFALLVAELAVRLVFPPLTVAGPSPQLLCEHDPLLGWRKRPGASGWMTHPEYRIFEKINAHGLRGPLVEYKKGAAKRVLILGDSFIEGYTSSEEELVTTMLSNQLNEAGNFEVINGGTGGYSTDQEYLFFKEQGIRYQPDVTVLAYFGNDLMANTTTDS